MSGGLSEVQARDLAVRVAGANHSRRLYGARGQAWARTLETVQTSLREAFDAGAEEVTLALLGEALAVQGVPVLDAPSSILRFIGQLKARDVEIVAFLVDVDLADLEALFAYLGADAADVAGVEAEAWLRERGVERVRIKHLHLTGGSGADSFRDVYFRGRRVLGQQFARAAKDGKVSAGAVHELARSLVEVISGSEAPLATLLAMKDRDDFLMVHAVNVATLVAAQASTMPMADADLEELVSAALTHDIGKTRVPEGVLRARGRLGDSERALLMRHTVEGARLLSEGLPSARLGPVVARYHHDPPPPDAPGLAAIELVRIADAFDGVRSLRPFDDAEGLRGAVTYMARRLGPRFNPYLLSRFARLTGVGAAGETGWLSTGEVVRILEPHPELAFHPVVQVVDPGEGRQPAGAQLDLAAQVGLRFVPKLPRAFRDLEASAVDDLG